VECHIDIVISATHSLTVVPSTSSAYFQKAIEARRKEGVRQLLFFSTGH